MLYTEATYLVEDAAHPYVVFDHGPLFYAVAAGLYVFVLSSLGVLLFAFNRATVAIRPFLGVLLVITAAPLTANFAYIVWGFTVFGFDPTPFMFAAALIAFSWLLTNNTMMDTEAQGRSLIFYATSDPVLITDSEFRFTGANPAATEIFGPLLPKPGHSLRSLLALAPILNTLDRDQSTARGAPVPLADRIFEPRILPIESPIRTRRNLLGWTISARRHHRTRTVCPGFARGAGAGRGRQSRQIAIHRHDQPRAAHPDDLGQRRARSGAQRLSRRAERTHPQAPQHRPAQQHADAQAHRRRARPAKARSQHAALAPGGARYG